MVDASALVAFFLREEDWSDLARYMVRTTSVDHMLKEFYNALWKSVSVRRYIDPGHVAEILSLLHSYVEKNMVIEPGASYLDEALEISLDYGITVYDSLYIAQALRHGKPLLTLDRRQREAASRPGVRSIP